MRFRVAVGAGAATFERSLPAGQRVVSEGLSDRHGTRGSRVVLRILLVVLPVVLAGYELDDRGFAYVASVPGTPIYAGEMVLLLGGLFVALATGYLRAALRRSLPMKLLLVFFAWGLSRTLPFLSLYGLDSIRDAALWYYALTAVLVATLVMAVPELPHRWARWYVPFLVVLLLWSPFAMILDASTLFSHKPGNLAVAVATAIGFLWLVPTHSLSRGARAVLTAFATVVILTLGTQNRGGLVAALAAILLTGVLLGRRSRNMAAVMVGTMLIGFVFVWGFDVHASGPSGRDYSVAQLVSNVASTTGAQDTGNLAATITFRDQLWSGVIALAGTENALPAGLGFGPNLAQELGISVTSSDPLRSPHNSHVDVFARMGIVGLLLWAAFWGSWYVVMFRRSRDTSGFLSIESKGLLNVCMVGAAGILVNAYFDPTLESPQVAIWLWALVGLGLGIGARGIALKKNVKVIGTHP